MRGTVFYKMTGSGNDFVMLDGRFASSAQWPPERIRALCDRRTGVGADGLVILTPERPEGPNGPEMPGASGTGPGAVRMVYWNADGSPAALCGNAALCSGRLVADLELAPPGVIWLLTDAGVVPVHAQPGCDEAEINLPDADLPREVPGLAMTPGERWIVFTVVGVPHLVVRVDDVEAVDVAGRGRALRFDPHLGPLGANVNFVSPPLIPGGPWLIRTYERGVEGETLACGTGTAAAGLALAGGGEAPLPVRFQSRGGPELQVRAEPNGTRATGIWLGGQSRLLFRGVWEG